MASIGEGPGGLGVGDLREMGAEVSRDELGQAPSESRGRRTKISQQVYKAEARENLK